MGIFLYKHFCNKFARTDTGPLPCPENKSRSPQRTVIYTSVYTSRVYQRERITLKVVALTDQTYLLTRLPASAITFIQQHTTFLQSPRTFVFDCFPVRILSTMLPSLLRLVPHRRIVFYDRVARPRRGLVISATSRVARCPHPI